MTKQTQEVRVYSGKYGIAVAEAFTFISGSGHIDPTSLVNPSLCGLNPLKAQIKVA